MKPLLFFCFLLAAAATGVAVAETRPNLVVVMVDDMGYAGVSCFGNPRFETPEIDRLAAEGMRPTAIYTTHLIDRCADEFVRRHAGGGRPFCLYISHEAIHNPVQVPAIAW